jgi:hypothetical protein
MFKNRKLNRDEYLFKKILYITEIIQEKMNIKILKLF